MARSASPYGLPCDRIEQEVSSQVRHRPGRMLFDVVHMRFAHTGVSRLD
jgi:hypothetical protein